MSPTNDAGRIGRGVDLDLLADHLEGVLPDARSRDVDRLIETDPAWAAARTALVDARVGLRAALAAHAARPEPMPEDISARIIAALHDLGPAPISLDAARRRRRPIAKQVWARIAVAASIVGVMFIGGTAWLAVSHLDSGEKSTATADRGSPVPRLAMTEKAPTVPTGFLTIVMSGQDYTPLSLGTVIHRPLAITTFGSNGQDAIDSSSVPDDLARLVTTTALRACVAAIVAEHGGLPSSVDFASYLGRPALIVTVTGVDLMVVVGDQCGLPGIGSNEIASAPLKR